MQLRAGKTGRVNLANPITWFGRFNRLTIRKTITVLTLISFSTTLAWADQTIVRVPVYGEVTDTTPTANSRVDVRDVYYTQQAALGRRTLTTDVTKRADINRRPSTKDSANYAAWIGNGTVTTADAARMLEQAVGFVSLKPDLKVTMINVGQGDSFLIEFPNGKRMLVDSGYFYQNDPGSGIYNNQTNLTTYLKTTLGITRLDYVVQTHPHSDHVQEMKNVFNAMAAGTTANPVYLYDSGYPNTKPDYVAAMNAAAAKNWTVIQKPLNGVVLNIGGVTVRFFSPHEPWLTEGDSSTEFNNSSIVFRMTYGKASFLFLGDAQSDYGPAYGQTIGGQQARILSEIATPGNPNYGQSLRGQVYKISHHGSNDATNAPVLDLAKPDIALLPYRVGFYGYPQATACSLINARSIPTYNTAHHGHVVIATDGQNIAVLPQTVASTTLVAGQ